jgi:NAD-dependent deacetylase
MREMSIEQGRGWIEEAAKIVGFTGAGISTESGVSDFRSPNGVWARNRTVYFDEFVNSREDRIEAWRQKVESWPEMRNARPNAGHKAFVELERRGKLTSMITQNIERLHQRSGLRPEIVLELHGTTTEAMCLSCGDRIAMDEAVKRVEAGDLAPECRSCGGLLKPATVSFGQAMPQDVLLRAQQATEECDLFLAVGSSLVVQPAAGLPVIAKQAGARLIIINREATPLDGSADLVLHGEIGKVLPPMVGVTTATPH